VGVFADGHAIRVAKSDEPAEPAVAQACGTTGVFSRHRYNLQPTPEELSCIDPWKYQFSVIAGLRGFEKTIAELPVASTEIWLSDSDGPSGRTAHPEDPGYQYVADFDGDGLTDYMYRHWPHWYVALSNGNEFALPTIWLSDSDAPTGSTVHPTHPTLQYVADFNGDGRTDYMYRHWPNPNWYVALSNGNGFDAPTVWLYDSDGPSGRTTHPFDEGYQYVDDFNADGRTDYMYRHLPHWYVALSNGDGFDPPTIWLSDSDAPTGSTVHPTHPTLQYVADFNGDGRTDYMYRHWPNPNWYVAVSNGSGFNPPTVWLYDSDGPSGRTTHPFDEGYQYVADFNADGHTDYMYRDWPHWYVALSNGNNFDPPTIWLSDSDSPNGESINPDDPGQQYVADFDGDGLTDYMWGYGSWFVSLSNGVDFEHPVRWIPRVLPAGPTFNNNPALQYLDDFSGDGRPDHLYRRDGKWYVTSTLAPAPDVSCNIVTQCNDGIDNDGDGRIDLADPGCAGPLDNVEFNSGGC